MNAAYIKHEPFGVLFTVTDENYKVKKCQITHSLHIGSVQTQKTPSAEKKKKTSSVPLLAILKAFFAFQKLQQTAAANNSHYFSRLSSNKALQINISYGMEQL